MSDKEVKVILLGNSGVGKTSLINICLDAGYKVDSNSNNIPTISGYYIQKVIECDGKKYILDLWDTAGQEAYLGITKLFFKGSEIIIFVYDVSALNSYNDLKNWIEMTEEIIDNKHICAIVGNKNDLYLEAKITEEEAKKFAESKNYLFKLVSAKTDPKGFSEFLLELVKEYKNKLDNPTNKRRKSIKLEQIPNLNQNEESKKKCCS
jgi:Ras-related protein Rab-1A